MNNIINSNEKEVQKLLNKGYLKSFVSNKKRLKARELLISHAVSASEILIQMINKAKFKKKYKLTPIILEIAQQSKPDIVREIIKLIHTEVGYSNNIYELSSLDSTLAGIINSSNENYIYDILVLINHSKQTAGLIEFYSETFIKLKSKAIPAIPLLLKWIGYKGNIEIDRLKNLTGDKNLDEELFQAAFSSMSGSSKLNLLQGSEYFSDQAKQRAAFALKMISWDNPEALISFIGELKSLFSMYKSNANSYSYDKRSIYESIEDAIDKTEKAKKSIRAIKSKK